MAERIMVVEDDPELRELLVEVLAQAGHTVLPFPGADAAEAALTRGDGVDLVLTDLIMPGGSGRDLLRIVRTRCPEINVIVMTAFGSIESAIELVRAGGYDYLTKPLGTDELLATVARALAESRPRREAARAARSQQTAVPIEFIGTSPPMLELYELVRRSAGLPHAVLITGESGTGKELVARALHRLSGRASFVTVNCGALPETLLESELFGHERGAFTGADRAKEGLFQVAHGGTLLLDEIAELPLALQPKLLRVLEQGEIRPLGATHEHAVDVRVLAATNRNLEAEVDAGRFRDDLYWRLNVLTLQLPPLRERPTDIPVLAAHFLTRSAIDPGNAPPQTVTADAMDLLVGYPWPGNARELRNTVIRAAWLAQGKPIDAGHLPERIRQSGDVGTMLTGAARRHLPLEEVERLYILEILRETAGNKTRAAELLGLDRKTLYRKMEEYRDLPGGAS
jgi:two-component system, NtrC family, response regulator AtoC